MPSTRRNAVPEDSEVREPKPQFIMRLVFVFYVAALLFLPTQITADPIACLVHARTLSRRRFSLFRAMRTSRVQDIATQLRHLEEAEDDFVATQSCPYDADVVATEEAEWKNYEDFVDAFPKVRQRETLDLDHWTRLFQLHDRELETKAHQYLAFIARAHAEGLDVPYEQRVVERIRALQQKHESFR